MWVICGRYLPWRSVSIPWRSITHGCTDRKKALQIATFMAVRSMRAVFCWALRQKIVLLADPHLLTSTIALQSPLEGR